MMHDLAITPVSSRPISRLTKANYFTGDGCRRDADGYYWITGRVDDVINVSGHRCGHRGGRVRWWRMPGVGSSRGRLSHGIRPGHLCLRTLMAVRTEKLRKAGGLGAQDIGRSPRPTRSVRAGPAETRSGKIVRRILHRIARTNPQPRRHLDARRPA
jgi:acetyl-CoA synthetase